MSGVFAAHCEAWSVGHGVKLWAMIGRCDGWMGRMWRRFLLLHAILFGRH